MGEIKSQGIQNSIIQYIGIVLGYFSSVFLFTEMLDTEQYGLTRVLFAISGIYVNVSSLGVFKIIVRFLPFFKTEDKGHQGFLSFNIIFSFLGFLFATFLYLLLKEPITSQYQDSTALFFEHYHYVILLSFLMLYTNIMESFLMAMKKTVLTYFLRNIFIRLIWILEITLFYYDFYDFETFLLLYVSTYFLNFLVMFFYLQKLGQIHFSLTFFGLRRRMLRVVTNYGLFSIVSGISAMLVNRIDIIMITFLMGLTSTSVYQIAFYISSVIYVPSQAIYRISMPVVAQQWKNRNMVEMKSLYQKSSLNQLLTGGFVFLLIWINIDEIFSMLKPIYAGGKLVVLILGISVLFNMMTGINQVILVITKYFRYDTYASIALAVLTVITNLTLIPIFGLEGAAFATLISVVLYHSFKFTLIQVKLKMQPFTKNTVWALLLIGSCYGISRFLPNLFDNLLYESIYKSIVIGMIYLITLYVTGISEDIKDEITKSIRRLSTLLGIK